MHPRQFARIGGSIMLVFGLIALIPGLSAAPADVGLPILNIETSYGLFLGLFAMNIVNKLVLIAFGIAGLYSSARPTTSLSASVKFCRWVFGVMGLGTILGCIPDTNTLFGYAPLFGGEIAAHAVFALLGAYFGFVLSSRAAEELRQRFPQDQQDQRRAG